MSDAQERRAELRQRLQALTASQRLALASHLSTPLRVADAPVEQSPQRLYAWLVAADPADGLDPQVLRRQLAQRLPGYMQPAHYCIREALPRTSNGKLDRAALQPDPEPDPDLDSGAATPREMKQPAVQAGATDVVSDAVSDTVLAVWREVLGSTRIAADDDFFELGGDSLLAMRVVSRLKRHFDTTLSPTDLFEHTSVAALAARLRALGADQALRREEIEL